MNDNSLMPFGKHKGKALANVPADYLLWLYENGINSKYAAELNHYIQDNLEVLQQQAKAEV